jgi:hypothetical protein
LVQCSGRPSACGAVVAPRPSFAGTSRGPDGSYPRSRPLAFARQGRFRLGPEPGPDEPDDRFRRQQRARVHRHLRQKSTKPAARLPAFMAVAAVRAGQPPITSFPGSAMSPAGAPSETGHPVDSRTRNEDGHSLVHAGGVNKALQHGLAGCLVVWLRAH